MSFTDTVEQYSLTIFFVLSYFITISAVLVSGLFGSWLVINPMMILSVFSPTISAIIVSGLIGGWKEIKKLFKGYLKWKVNYKWYLAGFFLMIGPLIFTLFYHLFGGESPGPVAGYTVLSFFGSLFLNLLMGPLSEEGGWRGFALPELESRFKALDSSLILGIIWACWHLPFYLVEPRTPLYIYIPLVLVITILMTWGYNNTNGSLIIPIIMHFSFNFNGRFITGDLGLLPTMLFNIAGGVMIGIYLLIVVAYYGREKLSRKPDSELPFTKIKEE
jgi:membrane protease YdiL (CAAX protease family)